MASNTEVIIEMVARPWNQTLKEVHIEEFPVTSVALLHLDPGTAVQITPRLSLPLVIRVSTIVRLIGSSISGKLYDSFICIHFDEN